MYGLDQIRTAHEQENPGSMCVSPFQIGPIFWQMHAFPLAEVMRFPCREYFWILVHDPELWAICTIYASSHVELKN